MTGSTWSARSASGGSAVGRLALAAGAVAALAVALAAPAPAALERAPKLRLAEPTDPPPPISLTQPLRDTELEPSARRLQAASLWGGTYRTANGRTIRMSVSDGYVADEAVNQRIAEWLSQYLYYGPELATAHFVFLTHEEIAAVCGAGAAGCYSPSESVLVVPGHHFPGLHLMTVLAHEYGHHVAANRDNAPWRALDWGAKRWASRANICALARGGTVFPEDRANRYRSHPGEAFAEIYAFAVNRGGGWADNWWPVWPWYWDASMQPTPQTVDAARRDAVEAWTAPAARSWSGRLDRKQVRVRVAVRRAGQATTYRYELRPVGPVQPKTIRMSPTLDGRLRATVRRPGGARLVLVDPATGAALTRPSASIEHTLCGERSLSLRVVAAAPGPFEVALSQP